MKKDLIILKSPKSFFAESIRSIRTNIAFSSLDDKEIKVILITSPEAGDGKSMVSANLAVSYAQEGKKVLLIDADLRRGRQHEIFEIMNIATGGYTNLILNYNKSTKLENYIFPTFDENIDILPTGPTPPNPVELLGSEANKKLLDSLKKKYDIIVIDCAPVVGLSDSLILAALSDINLLTVSAKKTKMESLEQAKKLFDQASIKISGVILNNINNNRNNYYNYYTSSYYSDESK